MIDLTPKQLASFWSKVSVSGNCWIWTAYKDRDGYGVFSIHIKGTRQSIPIKAYRLTYELFKEDTPKGLQIDHLCRNRACVNPDHLEVVTCKENVLRGIGLCSINARKTHCPQGHEYNEKNTYYDKNGGRYCRACHRQIQKRRYQLRKKVIDLD